MSSPLIQRMTEGIMQELTARNELETISMFWDGPLLAQLHSKRMRLSFVARISLPEAVRLLQLYFCSLVRKLVNCRFEEHDA